MNTEHSQLKYKITKGVSKDGSMVVKGHMARSKNKNIMVNITPDLQAQIEGMLEGGATSSACFALIHFGLDTLKKNGLRLEVLVS